MNNGYPENFVNKERKLHNDRIRKKMKHYEPQKLHGTFKLPYVGIKSHIFENKFKKLLSIYTLLLH